MEFRHAADAAHPIREEIEEVAREVVDAVYRVHRGLGPGLLERVYQICFERVLLKKGIPFVVKPKLPILFEDEWIPSGLEPDLLVGGCVVVELKAVEEIHPVFKAQLLTYLKLTQHPVGFLINFNVTNVGRGVKRFVNSATGTRQEFG